MIARIKKDSQDNLTWERLTSAVVGSTPLGAVYGIWSTTVPDGFLPCNGAQFDKTQYPFLYSMLGDDHTPDLRECTLVGIGENSTDSLTTHNIYTLGQFKDANFSGATEAWTTLHPFDATNNTMTTVINTTGTDKVVTAKSATAGAAIFTPRSKGINYIIKAIPGNEVGDYNSVINQLEAQLALKISLEYVNALPTGDNIESNIYGYNGHYYIGDKEHATLTQLVDNSDLTTLQPKTLDTSLTIGGQTITTVEAALSALNTVKTEKGINDVNALPVSPDIKDLIYRYNGNIYFGDSTNQTTALVNAASVDTVENGNMNPVTSNAVYNANTTKLFITGAPVITANTTYVDSLNQQWSQINNNTYHIRGNIVIKAGVTPGTQVLTLPFNSLMDTNLMLVGLGQTGQAQWLVCVRNSSAVTNAAYTGSNMLDGNWVFDWIISKVI